MGDLLWYAAYGSNLSRDRLLCYLRGGRPPGARRRYSGCRDAAAPRDAVPFMLDRTLWFGGRSTVWGGGIAFVDSSPHRPSGRTFAQAYLLTRDQIADIVAQENHVSVGTVSLQGPDLDRPALAGTGPYREVIRCGRLDGHPVVTVTNPDRPSPARLTAPTAPYLRTLARGLAASHNLGRRAVVDYLAGCPGIRGRWQHEDLRAIIATGTVTPA